ncbi:DNA cytosine methyltransferase, partial [Acidithiobacillus sp. MC6.1]|nr:DNA cytosine methyltransferase [Acidithiobacillus sp. MC6.1]
MTDYREIRHFHLFCGLGGGAAGFNRGHARVGTMQAKFRCIGGVDSSASAIADFTRLAGVPGTVLDLFDQDQYRAFHGKEPAHDWPEATPADIRKAAGGERPHIVFTSPPCKGFSGLLSQAKSQTEKYKALDRLTLRGIWLTLEAWHDDPPEFIIMENVPRIASRGRTLLDRIGGLLGQYGYAVAETTHDCGELGGLAQSRKRFLLVARHMEKVVPTLYEPRKTPLRAVGDVLGRMPLPGDSAGGVMHRVPSLQWKTWVRLAFVEAGSDWRSLNRLDIKDGFLRDYLILPERRADYLGVLPWESPSGAVSGRGTPTNGRYTVADPRFHGSAEYGQYGVRGWEET